MQTRLNIAVLGAGALGTLMAAELQRGGAAVTLVNRRAVAPSESYWLVPQLFGAPWSVELCVATQIPTDVDVVLVAVRAEQLDAPLLATLKASGAKAVLLFSPLMGPALAEWKTVLPGLCVGMPVLAAEFSKTAPHQLHYWQVPSTLIERGRAEAAMRAVVSALRKGGAWISWVGDAEARTLANTVALFPLHVAVFLKPSLRAWLADDTLRRDLAEALVHSLRLGKLLGPLEPGLLVLVWCLSSATRIALAVRIARFMAPGICAFVERHFGPKLGRQHAVLAREIRRLAAGNGVEDPLNEKWRARLAQVSS